MVLNVDPQLSQWDVGRIVSISDSEATHIHFANQGDSKAVIIAIENGSAKIPDYLLQTGKTVIAYAVKDGVTLESKSFSVRKRERPENYIYEDDQRNYIYELIKNAEDAAYDARMAAEGADSAAGNAGAVAGVAYDAAQKANLATEKANTATDNANIAAKNANEATTKAVNAVKNMMVVGEAKGESFALNDAIDQTLVGLRVFGKTTQNGTPTPDAPVELVSVGDSGSIEVMVAGKNLLKTTSNSTSINGVSFTVNGDGSITVNGTATGDTYFVVNESVYVGSGEYYLTGCPAGGSGRTYFLYISGLVQDFGYGVKSKLSGSYKIGICITNNSTVSNITFYPMLRPVYFTDGLYEPHKGQTMAISTPNGLLGFPVTSGGNYTDANGQRWICDEIDFARGVYVHRVHRKIVSNFVQETTANGTRYNAFRLDPAPHIGFVECFCRSLPFSYTVGTDSPFAINGIRISPQYAGGTVVARWNDTVLNNLDVMYILAEPIETPLSAEELAAYASLHTYKDNTTVSNDVGAWMELEYVMDAKKYIDSLVGTGGTILPARVE